MRDGLCDSSSHSHTEPSAAGDRPPQTGAQCHTGARLRPESWLTKGQEKALSRTDHEAGPHPGGRPGLASMGAQLAHPESAVTQQNNLFHSEAGPGARDAAGT